jgi:hypothetical protein
LVRFAVLTKLVRFAVLTKFVRFAVLTCPFKFAVLINPPGRLKEEMYPTVPRPTTVEAT